MRAGIIGIGAMGWAVAQSLMRTAHEVFVHDVREEANEIAALAGATVCSNAFEVAERSDFLLTLVVDGPQTEQALFGPGGASPALRPGQAVLMCSTMGVDEVARFGAQIESRGAFALDAPVSGGPDRAREAGLTMMVACSPAALEAARPVFDLMAEDVFHISERLGDGARVKLVNNLLAGINLVATAEALALGAKLGLDLPMVFDVIRHSSGQSWIGEDRYTRLLAGDHVKRSSPEILAKDLRLAISLAAGSGFDAVLAQHASQIFSDVGARYGERDDAEVVRWYDERSGTQVVSRMS